MHYLNYNSDEWKEIEDLISSDGIGVLHIWFGETGSALTMLNKIQRESKIPILVEADIESGLGRRYPGAVTLPPMMAIAATGNSKFAYEAGRISAEESRGVGIHFNLAPVVDVNNNPKNPIINTRSFGEHPDSVIKYSREFIKGLHEHGMLTTAKHFPGHGDTETDSHSSLAQIPSDSARLWQIELPPFKNAIESGVDAIMVAHVNSPEYQIHSEDPATLSKFWIQDVLRSKMKFDGVIITDAMDMGGIVKKYSDSYALIETIKAGSDIIIQNNQMKKSIDLVEKAVKNGIISEQRINVSALKVLKMKERLGLHKNKIISMDDTHMSVGKKSNFDLASEIANRSITLVKNNDNILPLKPKSNDTFYIVDLYDGANNHNESIVTKSLRENGYKVRSFQIDKSDSLIVANHILDQIPSDGLVLLNAYANPVEWKENIFLPSVEADFINRLIKKCSTVIITSFGSPYLIQDFPEAPVYICAYKGSSVMQKAFLNALMGESDINGILPVTIPGIAKRGSGINLKSIKWEKKEQSWIPGKEIKRIRPNEISVNVDETKQMLLEAVADSAFPGGVILAAKNGEIFLHKAFGYHTYSKKKPVMRGNIYDLASITKVVATTSALMKLVDEKKLSLDDKVITYLPEFIGKQKMFFDQKSMVTIRHLITHTSGLPPFKKYFLMDGNIQTKIDSIMNTEPEIPLNQKMIYSDIGLIVLGKIIESVSQSSLDEYVDSVVFKPLGMKTTFYNPPIEKIKRIIPTEYSSLYGETIIGYVHDENAKSIGGIAGHAGLFSTASDLSIFSQMMLNGGIYGWKRIFKSQSVTNFTKRANTIEGSSRALGWDTPSGQSSGGVYLSASSFGHTGFTGTSLWIDPENQIFVILLTNAVHPNRNYKNPNYFDWRQKIHSSVYEELGFSEKRNDLEWRERWIEN
tara:strand:- start:3192 stop:5954 length:2763 start_codon:yes stop_codon:yes gene_type:complete